MNNWSIEISEQEAKEMIAKISQWLKNGAPGNTVKDPYETAIAELARDFCHELLEAADASSRGGCCLCQS
jgi:hypothetical protein